MEISRNKIVLILVVIILIAITIPVTAVIILANDPTKVKVSLVKAKYGRNMSCIMIEANGKRVYIDPYSLPDDWAGFLVDLSPPLLAYLS